MTLTIRLSDEQATVLQARAAAEGLSVEQWIQRLAKQVMPPTPGLVCEKLTGADLIASLQASPYRDVDIEPERYRLPVRDVAL